MTNKKVVEIFFDVVSPYSRFAFETLCRYRPHWDMELRLRPFFLGGVMQGSGNKPPATNASKAAYLMTDLQRCADYFGLELRQPQNFWDVMVTKGTIKTQRFITAVDLKHPQFTEQLSKEMWKRIWEQAAQKAGMSEAVIDDALSAMNSAEVKDTLRAVTQEALDLGCFGAPFIVAHVNGKKEAFFGADRFPILAMVIGETWKGPLPGKSSRL
ncbi:glutathione S-transferase kappa 1-like isoform X2 [Littorina saxatilis]|uniref:glutathione S-transferase kappa 1-like isoform X2 n=1 Tax=Littorina saxatilis TaxID=31220 RepID=UPI0038B66BFF